MRRNSDKMLLENLVRKYGKNGVVKTINEMAYKYDYNRLSDCPLTYNTQLDFKKYFIKRSAQEGYEFNKNVFYFDYIDCVDTKTSRDIPGVKANKTLNFDEAYNRLLKYFLNNLQEQVNESTDDFETRELIYCEFYNAMEHACLSLQRKGIEITEDVVRTGVEWFELHNEFYEV